MEILETAPEDVRAFAAGEAGTVKVGIFSASNVVVDAITAYRASFPAVNFRITQDEFESACDITVSTVMPSSSNARGEGIAVGEGTLFRERIGIAVPESSSFGDVVSLDELADEPFVCLAGSRRLREVCDALCTGRAFHPRIGFEKRQPRRGEKGHRPRAGRGVLADLQLGGSRRRKRSPGTAGRGGVRAHDSP